MESREERNAGANPRWWILLAVVLALMAFVTAASAHAGRPRLSASRPAPPAAAPAPARLPAAPPTSAVPTLPEGGARAGAPAAPAAPGAPAETASDVGAAGPVVADTPTSAPTVPAVTVTPTSAVPAPPPQAPLTSTTTTTPAITYPGYLQSPDNVSAQYQATASGPLSATATWNGGATLTLAVACPGGQRSLTGPSGVAVSIVDTSGSSAGAPVSCTVTLSEPSGEASTVSYTLTVDRGA